MDFSTDHSYSRTRDTDTALSSSSGPDNTRALDGGNGLPEQLGPGNGTTLRHLHGHRLRLRSQASVCSLVAKWPMTSTLAMKQDMVLGSSLSSDVTMSPGSSAGHQVWHSTHGNVSLRHQCGQRWPGPLALMAFNGIRSY